MTTMTLLIVLATAATFVALITGVASMAHGGKFDQRHSNQFMFARIGLQGLTLLLLLAVILLATFQ